VLIVEDDDILRTTVAAALTDAGFTVRAVPDGRDFATDFAAFRPDAAVLDIMLPGPTGMALAAHLRRSTQTAVLFLTARDGVEDRLAGFDVGADDYLVKPVVLAELVARLRAVLRRTGHLKSATLQVCDLVIDDDAGQVLRAGAAVSVTATELRLLTYLARNRNRVLSKTQLLTQVWGYDTYDPNLVEAHISALRRKLEATGPRLIHTVRGVGYRLSEPTPPTTRTHPPPPRS
jgi:two-component system OmpR family response regulator